MRAKRTGNEQWILFWARNVFSMLLERGVFSLEIEIETEPKYQMLNWTKKFSTLMVAHTKIYTDTQRQEDTMKNEKESSVRLCISQNLNHMCSVLVPHSFHDPLFSCLFTQAHFYAHNCLKTKHEQYYKSPTHTLFYIN